MTELLSLKVYPTTKYEISALLKINWQRHHKPESGKTERSVWQLKVVL